MYNIILIGDGEKTMERNHYYPLRMGKGFYSFLADCTYCHFYAAQQR